jgi:hypothetical protein
LVAKDIIPSSDFLGISLNVVSNTKDVGAPMCIFVGKCPSIGGFLTINAPYHGDRFKVKSRSLCKWMLFQLVHMFIVCNGFGLT